MISLLEQSLGKSARIRRLPDNPADMRETAADISKARRLLDWAPQVNPEAGLQELGTWYRTEAGWLESELNPGN